ITAGPITPLGNSMFSVSQLGNLIVSNVTPEIPGGIALSFGTGIGVSARFDRDLPASLMPTGCGFRVTVRGLNSEMVGSLAAVLRGGALVAIPSWPINISRTYGGCLYSSNVMVGSVTGQTLPFLLSALPASVSAQEDNFGQVHLTLDYD